MKKLPLFLVCVFFIPSLLYGQNQSSVSLDAIGKVNDISLKQDYAYSLFKANDNKLVWYEGYTATLFIYDFSTREVERITLKEGRGPNEYKKISGLSLSNNLISLVDYVNAKLIRIKTSGEFLEDMLPSSFSEVHPIRMVSNNKYNILMDVHNQEAVFHVSKDENYKPLTLKQGKLIEEFPNIFFKEGSLTIKDNYLIHYTKYYPHIYIYDLSLRKLTKKIAFDESEVIEGRVKNSEEDVKMTFPPSKVDILNEDVVSIPNSQNRILLLAEGKSDSRNYGLDQLFEYDYKSEQFIATHNLGIEATELTINDNYLFVYSEEESAIFQYELVSAE